MTRTPSPSGPQPGGLGYQPTPQNTPQPNCVDAKGNSVAPFWTGDSWACPAGSSANVAGGPPQGQGGIPQGGGGGPGGGGVGGPFGGGGTPPLTCAGAAAGFIDEAGVLVPLDGKCYSSGGPSGCAKLIPGQYIGTAPGQQYAALSYVFICDNPDGTTGHYAIAAGYGIANPVPGYKPQNFLGTIVQCDPKEACNGGGGGGNGGGGGPGGGGTPPTNPTNPTPPCTFCGNPSSSGSGPGLCPTCTNNINVDITGAIKEVLDYLDEKQTESCTMSLSCIDTIAKYVIDQLRDTQVTCNECCTMLANNIGMSAADAIACAECTCQQVENQCYQPGVGNVDGPCTTCGQEPCCCQEGTCVPCGETPPPKQFWGLIDCDNRTSGITSSAAEVWIATGPIVGPFDKEQDALSAAEFYLKNNCPLAEVRITPPPIGAPVPGTASCTIDNFGTRDTAANYLLGLQVNTAVLTAGQLASSLFEGIAGFVTDNPELGADAIKHAMGTIAPMLRADFLAESLASMLSCQGSTLVNGVSTLQAVGVLTAGTNVNFDDLLLPVRYAIHAACPVRQLEPERAVAAWLAGSMGEGTLNQHFAIAGYCKEAVDWYKDAARSKFVPDQITELWNRGIINEAGVNDFLRRLGYVDSEYVQGIKDLARTLPSPSDANRLMHGGFYDPAYQAQLGLDAEFPQRYTKPIKRLFNSAGIADSDAQSIFASGYHNPAIGELETIWHRLRPRPGQTGQSTLYDQLVKALGTHDIPPYWQEQILSTIYRPIDQRHLTQAYNIGGFTDEQATDTLASNGYSDANIAVMLSAMRLVRDSHAHADPAIRVWLTLGIDAIECRKRLFARGYSETAVDTAMSDASVEFRHSPPAQAFLAGTLSSSAASQVLQNYGVSAQGTKQLFGILGYIVHSTDTVESYKLGTVTRQDAINELLEYGVAQERAETLLTKVDDEIQAQFVKTCVSSVLRRYQTGDLDAQTASTLLQGVGLTQERVAQTLAQWACETKNKGKEIGAGELCTWFGDGLIDPLSFVQRLQKVGYAADDAMTVFTSCQRKVTTKQQKEIESLLKQEQAALAKATAQAESNQRKLLQLQKSAASARQMAAKARVRRQQTLLTIARRIEKICLCDEVSAINLGPELSAQIRVQFGLTVDESLQVVTQAVETLKVATPDEISTLVNEMAAMVAANRDLETQVDDTSPVSSILDTQPSG